MSERLFVQPHTLGGRGGAGRTRSGQVLRAADLARELGFTDIDGRRVPAFELDA